MVAAARSASPGPRWTRTHPSRPSPASRRRGANLTGDHAPTASLDRQRPTVRQSRVGPRELPSGPHRPLAAGRSATARALHAAVPAPSSTRHASATDRPHGDTPAGLGGGLLGYVGRTAFGAAPHSVAGNREVIPVLSRTEQHTPHDSGFESRSVYRCCRNDNVRPHRPSPLRGFEGGDEGRRQAGG